MHNSRPETTENSTSELYTIDVSSSLRSIDSRGGDFDKTNAVDFETAIAKTGYGLYNIMLLLSSFVAVLANQFSIVSMSFLLPSAECDLKLSSSDKGWLNAMSYTGMIFSSFIWGICSDKYGRRILLVVSYAIDGLLNFIGCFSQTFWFLLLIKFFSGMVICGPLSMSRTYLAEFHGLKYRSKIILLSGSFVSVASICISGIAWFVIPLTFSWSVIDGYITFNSWRLFVAVGSLPSFLAAYFIYNISESPKFLMTQGQNEKALQVFKNIYKWNKGKSGESYPVKSLVKENINYTPNIQLNDAPRKSFFGVFEMLWEQSKPLFLKPHRPKALFVFFIQFLQLLCFNTLRLWLPQIFSSLEEYAHIQQEHNIHDEGVPLCEMLLYKTHTNETDVTMNNGTVCTVGMMKSGVYVNNMIVSIATMLTFFSASFTINYIGKKNMMTSSLIMSGVASVCFYWTQNRETTLSLSAIYIAMLGVSHIVSIAIVVDLFPTNLRNLAVSLTLMSGQIGTVLGNVGFPLLMNLCCESVFFTLGGIIFIVAALCFLLPNTNKSSLK